MGSKSLMNCQGYLDSSNVSDYEKNSKLSRACRKPGNKKKVSLYSGPARIQI
jgi:hypothetical protein